MSMSEHISDLSLDMHLDMCLDMCSDMCADMWLDMCLGARTELMSSAIRQTLISSAGCRLTLQLDASTLSTHHGPAGISP